MNTNNNTKSPFDEVIGTLSNSPFYTPDEARCIELAVKDAEDMTWEELQQQANIFPSQL